jgi:hypothetical protein
MGIVLNLVISNRIIQTMQQRTMQPKLKYNFTSTSKACYEFIAHTNISRIPLMEIRSQVNFAVIFTSSDFSKLMLFVKTAAF